MRETSGAADQIRVVVQNRPRGAGIAAQMFIADAAPSDNHFSETTAPGPGDAPRRGTAAAGAAAGVIALACVGAWFGVDQLTQARQTPSSGLLLAYAEPDAAASDLRGRYATTESNASSAAP
jgi:hypothetical protein